MTKVWINGVIREMTESEVNAIKAQNQQMLIESIVNGTQHVDMSIDEAMAIILSKYEVSTPNGNVSLADAVQSGIDLPYKVGYKWERQGTAYVSVADPDAVGTASNPLIYDKAEDIPAEKMVNGFYLVVGGVQGVWMGEFVEMEF